MQRSTASRSARTAITRLLGLIQASPSGSGASYEDMGGGGWRGSRQSSVWQITARARRSSAMAEFDGVVHGLDGGTPLGFLAGVGLQRVLSARFPSVTLAWRLLDAWRPVIQGVASFDFIVDGVLEDADRWRDSALLQ